MSLRSTPPPDASLSNTPSMKIMTWLLEEPRREIVEKLPRPPDFRIWTAASFCSTSARSSIFPSKSSRLMTETKPVVSFRSTSPVWRGSSGFLAVTTTVSNVTAFLSVSAKTLIAIKRRSSSVENNKIICFLISFPSLRQDQYSRKHN